jgi:hypothetical protein
MFTIKLMKQISPVILILLATFCLNAQEKPALSPRNANYTMDVKLDPDKKLIKGDMLLNWINISPDTIRELQFHLYLNAFKNTESTFMKGSGGSFRGSMAGEDNLSWGYSDILEMELVGGESLSF